MISNSRVIYRVAWNSFDLTVSGPTWARQYRYFYDRVKATELKDKINTAYDLLEMPNCRASVSEVIMEDGSSGDRVLVRGNSGDVSNVSYIVDN